MWIAAAIARTEPVWAAEAMLYARNNGCGLHLFTADNSSGVFGRLCHRAIGGIADTFGHHSEAATGRILEKITEIVPDVVHLVDLISDFYNYPMLLRGLRALPVEIVVEPGWKSPAPALWKRPQYNGQIISRILEDMPRIVCPDKRTETAAEAIRLYNSLSCND